MKRGIVVEFKDGKYKVKAKPKSVDPKKAQKKVEAAEEVINPLAKDPKKYMDNFFYKRFVHPEEQPEGRIMLCAEWEKVLRFHMFEYDQDEILKIALRDYAKRWLAKREVVFSAIKYMFLDHIDPVDQEKSLKRVASCFKLGNKQEEDGFHFSIGVKGHSYLNVNVPKLVKVV